MQLCCSSTLLVYFRHQNFLVPALLYRTGTDCNLMYRSWASFAEHAHDDARANIHWAIEKWADAVFAAIFAFCADADCKEALHEAVSRVVLVATKLDDSQTREHHTFALDKDQQVI